MDDITNSPSKDHRPGSVGSGGSGSSHGCRPPPLVLPSHNLDTFEDEGDTDLWDDEHMATPPPHDGMDSGSPPRSPEFDLSLFDSSGTSHSVTPPFSPHRPTSRLGGGQHESFLRLRGVPGTPKTLLHRKRILMDDDGDASGGRPSTAPELGRPPERRTNKNPFQTQSASKPKRLALDSSAPPVGSKLATDSTRAFRTRSNSIFSLSPPHPPPRGASPAKAGPANISRYAEEFEEVCKLGEGEFGTVTLCRNRIDGTLYAIKRSKKRIAGLAEEKMLLREVYAHAVISSNTHIVRYFSAWHEDDRMVIQNEYCDGGTLEQEMQRRRTAGKAFTESEVVHIIRHVALGLKCLHAKKLAHLDIKPGNIFMKSDEDDVACTPRLDDDELSLSGSFNSVFGSSGRFGSFNSASFGAGAGGASGPFDAAVPPVQRTLSGSSRGSMDSDGTSAFVMTATTVFKIGDLGQVVKVDDTSNVEEGDCRYGPDRASLAPKLSPQAQPPQSPDGGDARMHAATSPSRPLTTSTHRYMAMELLNEEYTNLQKADIFSLGISIHELASCEPLPKNGDRWQELRSGKAGRLERYSPALNALIEEMLHPDPAKRPSARGILRHAALHRRDKQRTKGQLELELEKVERERILLLKQIADKKKSTARPAPTFTAPMGGGAREGPPPVTSPQIHPMRRNSAPPNWGRPKTSIW